MAFSKMMTSSSSSVKMSSSVANKGLLALLGLTVSYQVIYQAFLYERLPNSDDDATCQVSPFGPGAGTPQCLEQQLFRTWQRAESQNGVLDDDEEELERLTQVRLEEFRSPIVAAPAPIAQDKQGSGILVGPTAALTPFGKAAETEDASGSAKNSDDSTVKVNAEQNQQHNHRQEYEQAHKKFEEDFEKLYEQTMDKIHHPTKNSYAQHAEEVMKEMEHKKWEIEHKPSVKHARALARQAKLDKLYDQTLASIRNRHVAEDYAHELSDMMHKFDERADHLPSVQRAKALEHQRKFDELYDATMAHLNNHSSTSAWGAHLQEEQHELEYKLEHLHDHDHHHHKSKFDELYDQTMAHLNNHSATSAWGAHLQEEQHELEYKLEHLHDHHHHHGNHSPSVAAPKASILDQIVQFGHKLCNSTDRQGHAACSEFHNFSRTPGHHESFTHALSAEALARHQHHVDWRAHLDEEFAKHTADYEVAKLEQEVKDHVWAEKFQGSVTSYLDELCADPGRAAYPACATLRKRKTGDTASQTSPSKTQAARKLRGAATEASSASASATAAPSKRLRGAPAASNGAVEISAPLAVKKLRGAAASSSPAQAGWAAVVAAGAGSGSGAHTAAVATREELMAFTWQEKLPSVACIVAITSDSSTADKLSALVNNFKLQTYEGKRTLLMLYKPSDTAVATLLPTYADGVLVKALPVRGNEVFPYTTAWRYGAWAAEADVIARWNAEEWYHPQRLAMQVEAMVLTSRPVSMLKSWTFHGASTSSSFESTVVDQVGWEGSIVGEKKWMLSHWMPMMKEERSMLGGVQAGGVVQVDMPELLAYRVEETADWHHVLEHFHVSEDQVSLPEAPQACAKHAAKETADLLQLNVDEKLGAELGGIYKTLVKSRTTVSSSLSLLCEELAESKQPAQRQRLAKQADHISDILVQINQRFDAVDRLLH